MANVYKLAPWILKWEGGFVNDPADLGVVANLFCFLYCMRREGKKG